MAYLHQLFWDSMHARFASALLHFQPLVYHSDLAYALRSELVGIIFLISNLDVHRLQYLLRSVIGDARLRYNQLPPRSPFMRVVQEVLVDGKLGGWIELRAAAESYLTGCGGSLPVDHTGLPQWWKRYAPHHLDGTAGPSDEAREPWDVCKYIIRSSGSELGSQVRGTRVRVLNSLSHEQASDLPEGNLGGYIASINAIDRRMREIQKANNANWQELGELEHLLGVELMEQVRLEAVARAT